MLKRRNIKKIRKHNTSSDQRGRSAKDDFGPSAREVAEMSRSHRELARTFRKAIGQRDVDRIEATKQVDKSLEDFYYFCEQIMSILDRHSDAFSEQENNAELPAEMGTATVSIPRPSAGDSDASLEEFEQIARAAHSDPDALAKLRRIFRESRKIWRDAGDLAHRVMVQISNQLAENDLITFEAIRATLLEKRENIAKEAAGTYPPAVLELLLDQFCCSYLTYYHHQIQVVQKRQSRTTQKFWEVQTTRAQKRLGKSLEFFRLKEQEKSTADSSPSADQNKDENRASKPKPK